MNNFEMSFAPESLKQISQLYGLNVILQPEFQEAMSQGGDLFVNAAIANTWASFQNPSGQLASTIHKIERSPYEEEVVVDSPYGHRREVSFKGPDSLGRMFPNDPAAYYMQHAHDDNLQTFEQMLDMATEAIFARMAAQG